jgi:hypothetical protein
MLIVLLVLTFTVLPYLTSELMGALTSTSKYQRNRSAELFGAKFCIIGPAQDAANLHLMQ